MNRYSDKPEPMLEISELRYSYTTEWLFRKIPALRGVTLSVFPGEAFGFLGPNGAGKTTTIKCILGLMRPASGFIRIGGMPCTDTESRRLLGYLPEQPYFYDHLSTYELVKMYAVLAGMPVGRVRKAVDEALELTGVAAKAKAPLRTLSKGLMQRVGMAQAIVAKPKLLVLDEPFSGLDPVGRKEFRELLLRLKQEGTTIFMSSHILSDVEFVCDRASILVNGELRGILDLKKLPEERLGSVTFTISNYEEAEAGILAIGAKMSIRGSRLSATFEDRPIAERALLAALASGASLESFDYDVSSLEEVFMDLIKKTKEEEARQT